MRMYVLVQLGVLLQVNILGYISTYYAIASSWPMTIVSPLSTHCIPLELWPAAVLPTTHPSPLHTVRTPCHGVWLFSSRLIARHVWQRY